MTRLRWQSVLVAVLATLCGALTAHPADATTLILTSPSFAAGAQIPAQQSCDAADQSPALSWRGAPASTQRFALIVDDPDAPAGTWVHWVVYDLPADTTQLPAGVPKEEMLPAGGMQGVNDFRKLGYYGPCPPPGKPHRYFFKLYALDRPTGLKPRATKAQVLQAIEGHVAAQTELMGTYQR